MANENNGNNRKGDGSNEKVYYKAWIPTPSGFINFSKYHKGYKKVKFISTSKQSDVIFKKIFNLLHFQKVTIKIEEEILESKLKGRNKKQKEKKEYVKEIKGIIIQETYENLLLDLVQLLIINGSFFIAIFSLSLVFFWFIVDLDISTLLKWIIVGTLFAFEIIIIYLLSKKEGNEKYELSQVLTNDNSDNNKANDKKIDTFFYLKQNGIICFEFEKSGNDYINQNFARHAFHRLCDVLDLHRNRFHDNDNDNLLIPQKVESKRSKDWYNKFIEILYDDVSRSRLENENIHYTGAIGTLEYIKIFRRVVADEDKSYEHQMEQGDEFIEMERNILKYRNEHLKTEQQNKLIEIEKEENKIVQVDNIMFQIFAIGIAAGIIIDLYINIKNPESLGKAIQHTVEAGTKIIEILLKSPYNLIIFIIIGVVLLHIVSIFLIWLIKKIKKIVLYFVCIIRMWIYYYFEIVLSDKCRECVNKYKKTEKFLKRLFYKNENKNKDEEAKIKVEEKLIRGLFFVFVLIIIILFSFKMWDVRNKIITQDVVKVYTCFGKKILKREKFIVNDCVDDIMKDYENKKEDVGVNDGRDLYKQIINIKEVEIINQPCSFAPYIE